MLITGAQLLDMYASFVEQYPVVSIEDGFAEVEGYETFVRSPEYARWFATRARD